MHKALLIFVTIVFGVLTAYTLAYYGGLFAWLAFYTRAPAILMGGKGRRRLMVSH